MLSPRDKCCYWLQSVERCNNPAAATRRAEQMPKIVMRGWHGFLVTSAARPSSTS